MKVEVVFNLSVYPGDVDEFEQELTTPTFTKRKTWDAVDFNEAEMRAAFEDFIAAQKFGFLV